MCLVTTIKENFNNLHSYIEPVSYGKKPDKARCDELATCLGWTPPSPNVNWDWLQPDVTLQKEEQLQKMSEWMN